MSPRRYYDEEFLRDGVRAALAARLADGLPAGGDPRGRRLRSSTRTSASRSSSSEPTDRGEGLSQRLPPPGVKLARASGTCPGFICPFHGWRWGIDGENTFVYRRSCSPRPTSSRRHRMAVPRRDRGGCAFINFDDHAPPLRESIEPFASIARCLAGREAEGRMVVVRPPAGQLEAGHGGLHGRVAHHRDPPAIGCAHAPCRPGSSKASQALIDEQIHHMRVLSEGMAGMTHEKDIRVAEGLRDLELPHGPRAGQSDLAYETQRCGRRVEPHGGHGHPLYQVMNMQIHAMSDRIQFMLLIVCGTFFAALLTIGIAELIKLLIDMEHNTRVGASTAPARSTPPPARSGSTARKPPKAPCSRGHGPPGCAFASVTSAE